MEFAELAALAGGHAEARAIQTAVKLGVFEALEKSKLDATALADRLGTNPRATGLLANAMVALGLLDETGKSLRLTEYLAALSAQVLVRIPGRFDTFRRSNFRNVGAPRNTRSAAAMQNLRREQLLGWTASRALAAMRYVADHLDLRGVAAIADVGGGPGTYVAAMLNRWPHLHAAIYDLPATLEVARRILSEREPRAASRIDLASVDYLREELPGPCGALFMSNIIHSEDEAANAELFRKCFRALEPGRLMIVKDHIMNDALTEPRAGAIFALYLLLTTRGRDYSYDEVARWLGDAGFVDVRHEQLPSPPFTSSMVLARKP